MSRLATIRGNDGSIPGDPDSELMTAFRDGDEEAFVRIYERYRDRIVAFTSRMLGSASMGEEAAQDVFLKLYRARKRYKPTARFSTYIYRIATRHCLNLKERHSYKKTQSGLDASREKGDHEGPADALRRQELRSSLRKALDKLPSTQRAALVLVHYEGLSYRECADTLAVSESALKSLIHRARGRLTELLDRELADPMELEHAM